MFNLIKTKRNLDKGVSKVLARCGQGSVFVPLLASCCAVLMCASSCNKSDNGNTRKNRLGTHDAANTEDSGATHSTSLFNSRSTDSSDSSNSAGLDADVKPGQWYLFKVFQVDLIKGDKHYDIYLNDKKISPKVFGGFVLRSFLLPGKGCNYVGEAINSLPFEEQGAGLQGFDATLSGCLIASPYFKLLDYFDFQNNPKAGRSSCDLKSREVVISCYIVHVLFSLVRNNKYGDALNKSWCLRPYPNWMEEYAVGDKGSGRINEVCACLGQDIIDGLGAQKENGGRSYIPSFYRERPGSKDAERRWFFLDEVSLGWGLNRKVDTIYTVRDEKIKKSKNMSFGFQTIAEVAKDVLCQNFGPLSMV